jgi:uncharacterized membrane protein YdbT with pleckstrin-like domain
MGYVDRILQPGEQRLHSGKIHWVVYLPSLAICLAAVVLWLLALGREPGGITTLWLLLAALCAVVGLLWLGWTWFDTWTTEIEATDRRIIYKRGFIRRETQEMNMDKVESVSVDQSILGRILGYGVITLRGTGAGDRDSFRPLKWIAAPLDFRNHVTAR